MGIFFLVMLVPLYGKVLDRKTDLSGVTAEASPVDISVKGILDGSTQAALNSVWEERFPGKKALIKCRSQLLYSALSMSPNQNVLMGKDRYLFEPDYVYGALMSNVPYDLNYYAELGEKLGKLRDILAESGKELYVFVTPSKARFYDDKISSAYQILDRREEFGWDEYGKLKEAMDANGILYYDAVAYVAENLDRDLFASPPFYATGIHWSDSWGKSAAAEFLDFLRENSRYDLGSAYVKEEISPVPVFPATDLYDTLNLFTEAKDTWYRADIFPGEEGKDHPNVFARGGSFMGQSICPLIWLGVFGEDIYYENYYYYTDTFANYTQLSGFSAYEEADIDRYLGQSDILLLEVNEAAINRMSFGFIDYLLEHPEFCDGSISGDVSDAETASDPETSPGAKTSPEAESGVD